MDNASLIEQCSSGSKEAMESLYCRYSMRMMRVIRRYVSDTQCSEDILHDGFVLIFTHISEVRQPERLEFWMGTIMKNLCLNYLSNLDVKTMLDEEVELPEIPELEDILSYEELEQLINRLPDGYRTVFKLAVLEGKSHKEIGRLLGISPNSSSSQLFHAKALLRKLIIERKKQVGLILLSLFIAFGAFVAYYKRGILDHNLYPEVSFGISQEETPDNRPFIEIVKPEKTVIALERAQKPSVVSFPEMAVQKPSEAESQSTWDEEQSVAEESSIVDTIAVPHSREEFGRRTVFDIPRKSVAKAGWTVGAHYSVGTRTPSLAVGEDLYAGLWSDLPDGNIGIVQSPESVLLSSSFYHETDYDLPMTFGLSVAKKITRRLSLETGINYTYMRATLRYTSLHVTRTVKSSFVGIPVKIDYSIYSRSRFSFYVTAGGSVDFPVGKHVRTLGQPVGVMRMEFPELKSRPEFSVHGGLGLQYSLTPAIGLYIEPSVRHYFKNGATSPSYWQEHRTLISLPIGIKINL